MSNTTSISGVSNTPTFFPAQKLTDKQKTPEYFRQCVEAGISLTWWNLNSAHGVRSTRKNKITNYNLLNDIIDKNEMERVTNPYRFQDMDFPLTYRNYPLLIQNINLLSGEERRRFFNPVVTTINHDAISTKLNEITDEFNNWAVSKLTHGQPLKQEDLQGEIERFNQWKLNFRDERERMAQNVIEYGYRTLFMKDMFSSGFEDLLAVSEEIFVADIYGNEPILRKGHPLCFFTLRSGTSSFIEDSDIIIEDGFLPVGEVLDRYHDELKDSDVKILESGGQINKGGIGAARSGIISSIINTPSSMSEYQQSTGDDIGDLIMSNRDLTFTYGGYFDTEGNVRVTRVVWKGMRKVGVKIFNDEDGNEVKELVPEQYKPNTSQGEKVDWMWIGEWYEGTRIGQDIFVRMRVLPTQTRHMDNPSKCSPGIVGIISNLGISKGKSFVDLGKDYQYLYNAFMFRLEQLFIKSKGKIGKLPLHLIPDGWTIDKALYYAEYLGWLPVDNFNEGSKGNSLGKLAGNMNDNSNVIDLSFSQDIQQCFLMLDFISRKTDDLTGISPQRKGAVENRETKGGVERAVTQSSLSTEKWYSLHDSVKLKALKAYLEVCKTAWRKKSFKRNYVLDDGSMAILDFDGPVFGESEYGIDISTSNADQDLIQTLRDNVAQMIQNQTPMSVIIDLYRTKNPGTLQRKIEALEAKAQENAQQQQDLQNQQLQAEQQAAEKQHQDEMDLAYEKLDREDRNKQLDREYNLTEVEMSSLALIRPDNGTTPETIEDIASIALEREKLAITSDLKNRELNQKRELEGRKIDAEKDKLKVDEKMQEKEHKMKLRLEKIKARKAKSTK